MAGNVLGKSSYANITGKPSGKKVNVYTLFTPEGNGIDVVVLVDYIHAISERFANTAYGFFLGKKVAYPIIANYVRNTWGKYELVRSMFSLSTRLFSFQFSSMDGLDAMLKNGPWFIWNNLIILKSSFARVMIELQADVELRDYIVVVMPKITREGHYICVVEKKIVKKPSQTSPGVLKGVEPTIEVSNSNPFDVLNLVDNDVEFGTNGRNSNLVNNEATLSGSSFMNIDNNRVC
nr:hypothetical protein [Tanacetum cinerariifolium]